MASPATPTRNRGAGRRARIWGKDLLSTANACAYLRIGKTMRRQYIADSRIHPIRLDPKLRPRPRRAPPHTHRLLRLHPIPRPTADRCRS